jgi:hypothetical protein
VDETFAWLFVKKDPILTTIPKHKRKTHKRNPKRKNHKRNPKRKTQREKMKDKRKTLRKSQLIKLN